MSTEPETGSAAVNGLRARIDAGRARDKVGAEDPSAAPLGTDEEAAGTPIPLLAAREAARQAVAGGSNRARSIFDGRRAARSGFIVAAIIVIILGVAAVTLWRSLY